MFQPETYTVRAKGKTNPPTPSLTHRRNASPFLPDSMAAFDEDPFMLVRAMVLTEFRCPPMPIAGQRFIDDKSSDAVINSHDLMATFMAESFRQDDESRNSVRRQIQVVLRDRYMRELSDMQSSSPQSSSFGVMYEVMSRHTREYMATYLLGTPFSVHDIRVLPPEYITPRLAKEIDHYGRALQIIADDRLNQSRLVLIGADAGGDGEAESRLATNNPVLDYRSQDVVQTLLMRCAGCAIEHKEEGVVHEPVLKRMRSDIGAE